MGQTPPKQFSQPMAFGSSLGSNVLQQSQPVAQVPQPTTPYTSMYDQSQQPATTPQSATPQPQQAANYNQPFYGYGGNYQDMMRRYGMNTL